MNIPNRLSEVVGRLMLCDGVSIPLREGFFHCSRELGVCMDEIDALFPENPYSMFRADFKKVLHAGRKVASIGNKSLAKQRQERLDAMLAVFDDIPELHNDSGKRWHTYNPQFLPLDIFADLIMIVSDRFTSLGLATTPAILKLKDSHAILPIVWFEAWKMCFQTKFEFADASVPLAQNWSVDWQTRFVDKWCKPLAAPAPAPVDATEVKDEAKVELVDGSQEQVVKIPEFEPDSMTEAYLGKRVHNPVRCDATMSFMMEFNRTPQVLESIIDMLHIRDIDTIDEIKVSSSGIVEVIILTTIVDGYPAKSSIQVDKLTRLSGIVDKVYNSILSVLDAAEEQSEQLGPLFGASRVQVTEQELEQKDDNSIH